MRVKVHVHAAGSQFVSCCDSTATVFELRRSIERQFRELNPGRPPLASHALQDKDGYLLSNSLLVGDVLQPDDQVSVVLKSELQPADQADLDQVLNRWRHFERYTLMAIASNVRKRRLPSAVERHVGRDTVLILFEMLASSDRDVVAKASATLRDILSEPHGSAEELGLCQHPDDPLANAGKWLSFAVNGHADSNEVAINCAKVLLSCLERKDTNRAMVRGGAAQALLRLSASDNKDIRALATRGLMCVSNRDKVAAGAFSSGSTSNSKGVRSKSSEAESKADARHACMSVTQALESLETTELAQVRRLALDAILMEAGEESVRSLTVQHGVRLMDALRRVVRLREPENVELVGELLLAFSSGADESVLVYQDGGFELLVKLAEEEGYAQGDDGSDDEQEGKSDTVQPCANALRMVCYNADHECPLKLLVDALVQSSCAMVRVICAEALAGRAKRDDDNALFTWIPSLLSALAQAPKDSSEASLLAQTVCSLTVKEINKTKLIKYGAPAAFRDLLLETSVELQRVAAKALANLASSTDHNRDVVLHCIQAKPDAPLASFHDSIVRMYLEMIFVP
ncbi:Cytokin_check_N domain-containing protein [Durusdinium trenchii]|uniref:Cytokin_check_N domain-containing protein n=1 Tax=Durusdinium trenchii TaxID=1381693 RepID=A0ABP0SR56_9DINO